MNFPNATNLPKNNLNKRLTFTDKCLNVSKRSKTRKNVLQLLQYYGIIIMQRGKGNPQGGNGYGKLKFRKC